jgi:outer membrane protein assembly factor BamA
MWFYTGRMRVLSHLALVALALSATGCKDEGTIRVHSLKFNGVKAVDEGHLKDALATKQSSKIPWGKKTYFDRSRFDADLKRVQAFYADRGFPDARVTGFDVKLNDKQDQVDVTVNISEGDPVVVEAVNFNGFDVLPGDQLNRLRKQQPLQLGQARDRQLVVSAHEMAINALREYGYPYAKVATEEDDGADAKHAVLTFTADPGKLTHFGPVTIQGNKSVSNRVIERQLTFKPGDLYRRSVVQDSQRRLYGLELFQFANIEPLNSDRAQPGQAPQDSGPTSQPDAAQPSPTAAPEPDQIPMRVTVAEGNHQRVNFGVGYGTEEKGRVDAEYHQLNFFGGARSAGAHVRYSSLDRGIRLDFNQPYFFTPHFSLSGEAQQWYTYTPAYRSVVTGAKVTVTHRTSAQSSWAISNTSERDNSSVSDAALNDPSLYASLIALGLNPITGEQNGTLNALGFDIQHSTADNVLNAHRGYQVAFHTEEAGRVIPGTFNYYALSADGRQYQRLGGGDRFVLASRLQLGNIYPFGSDEDNIPFSKRYFLGGATSVRGWGRYEISPLSASGQPVGGDAMLAWSEELRAAIHGNLGGVVFMDAGNVWAKTFGWKLNDLRYAIGAGLRYSTPIGPIRFDYGYQLNPIPDLVVNGEANYRRWRMHFSIGQAF